MLSGQDLERDNPVFLIYGWLLTDALVTNKPTYIGEFSNLQRRSLYASPHGKARYQLTLRYKGAPRIVSVDFWQLSSEYVISLNGERLAEGVGNGRITFLMAQGDHILTVETASNVGYYSGMYFPPALGTQETLLRVSRVQSFAYAVAFILPLALAVFTLFLWRSGGGLSRWFGWLCCSYALYMLRYFVFLFAMPVARHWFFVQSLALYSLCFSVVQLTVLVCGEAHHLAWRWLRTALLALSALLLFLCVFIPILPWAVLVHGRLTDFYYMVTFAIAAFFAVRGITQNSWESRYTLTG